MTKNCGTCLYKNTMVLESDPDFREMVCTRYPPVLDPNHKYAEFPKIKDGYSCGEWQPEDS